MTTEPAGRRARPAWQRATLIGTIALGYVAASQWVMTRATPSRWDATLLVGPMLAAIGVGAWRGRQRGLAAALGLALAGLVAMALAGWIVPAHGLALVQHVAVHLGLAALFGATLQPGREALITTLARRVHAVFTPALARYTRACTVAWTVYFVAMAALSVALFAALPFAAWATYANLASPLAALAMFVGEYALRYRLHPEFERTTLAQAVRSYRAHTAGAKGAPR